MADSTCDCGWRVLGADDGRHRPPLDQVIAHIEAVGVSMEEGPVDRTGAVGPLRSVYLRDPDGNLLEVANHLPAR